MSATTHRPRRGLMAGVLLAVIVADQLSKHWALNNLDTQSIDVVWTLRFHLVFNKGAAFSMFNGGGAGPIIAVIAMGVVGVLVWQGRTATSKLGAIALGLVAGGAMGNLIDRAFRGRSGFLSGAVVDFIDFQWYPVFNIADMGVVIGGIALGIVYAFAPDPDPHTDPEIDPETDPETDPGNPADGAGPTPSPTSTSTPSPP